ncbi:MAG: DUF1016 family protein [Caldilinea sp. CFX5]|nr:DUF1016 family protein [Caldilinea sp. CFX5]
MSADLQQPSRFFTEIRAILHNARQQAYSAVAFVMVEAYWQIGKRIVEEEQQGAERAAYGKKQLRELAQHLTAEFGNGFSVRNLEYMRKFFLTYRQRTLPIAQTVSAQSGLPETKPTAEAQTVVTQRRHLCPLSWLHYVFLMAITDDAEREFYEIEAAQQQWSLRELKRQFNTSLYERLALSRDKAEITKLAQQGTTKTEAHGLDSRTGTVGWQYSIVHH